MDVTDPAANTALLARLTELGAQVRTAVPLAELTTLRVGGPAAVVARCADTETLAAVVRAVDEAGAAMLLVGGGSNLVVGDDGFAGVVVQSADAGPAFERVGGPDAAAAVRAWAGTRWDALVEAAVADGYGGLECLSGIPGSVGAAPVQNIGAYGVEVGSVLARVRLLERASGIDHWVTPDALGLAYRTSRLKGSDEAVVLEVEFTLHRDRRSAPLRYPELSRALGVDAGASAASDAVRAAVLGLRRQKGMVLDPDDPDTYSVGSFFTNPVVDDARLARVQETVAAAGIDLAAMPTYPGTGGIKLSAAWLIERAGFAKGYPGPDAPARLSTKHTLSLTNRGDARSTDVVALARRIRAGVAERFGVELTPEAVFVNASLD